MTMMALTKLDDGGEIYINALEIFSVEVIDGVTIVHGAEDIHRVKESIGYVQSTADQLIGGAVERSLREVESKPWFKKWLQEIYLEYHIKNIDLDDRRKFVQAKYMEKLKSGGIVPEEELLEPTFQPIEDRITEYYKGRVKYVEPPKKEEKASYNDWMKMNALYNDLVRRERIKYITPKKIQSTEYGLVIMDEYPSFDEEFIKMMDIVTKHAINYGMGPKKISEYIPKLEYKHIPLEDYMKGKKDDSSK